MATLSRFSRSSSACEASARGSAESCHSLEWKSSTSSASQRSSASSLGLEWPGVVLPRNLDGTNNQSIKRRHSADSSEMLGISSGLFTFHVKRHRSHREAEHLMLHATAAHHRARRKSCPAIVLASDVEAIFGVACHIPQESPRSTSTKRQHLCKSIQLSPGNSSSMRSFSPKVTEVADTCNGRCATGNTGISAELNSGCAEIATKCSEEHSIQCSSAQTMPRPVVRSQASVSITQFSPGAGNSFLHMLTGNLHPASRSVQTCAESSRVSITQLHVGANYLSCMRDANPTARAIDRDGNIARSHHSSSW
jgi:hypothetical protein